MKKFMVLLLCCLIVVSAAACSSKAPVNPFDSKEYAPLEYDGTENFETFFGSLRSQYTGLTSSFSNYLEKHSADFDQNKGFYDLEDFEESMDDYYKFLNSVLLYDEAGISENYKEVWSAFKSTVQQNKTDLDGLYAKKGKMLVDSAASMADRINDGYGKVTDILFQNSAVYKYICESVVNALPNYTPSYSYNAENKEAIVTLICPEGVASALESNPEGMRESWNQFTTSLINYAVYGNQMFLTYEYEMNLRVELLSDVDKETVLFSTVNDQVQVDILNQ